jgi:hypothetical protein
MAGTGTQINWANVVFGTTPIKRVTNAMFGMGGSVIKFKGDVDVYPSVVAAVDIEPHASVTTGDPGTMMTFTPGQDATLAATMKDAKGTVGGDVIFTLTHAVFENADTQGQHAQFGSVTGTWQAYTPDGITPPLSIARS